jgi:hypothetical protein
MAQALRWYVDVPAEYAPDAEPVETLVKLMDELRDQLTGRRGLTHEGTIEAGALIGFRGRLFEVDGTLTVIEWHHPYAAIGAADAVAIGSLATTHRPEFAGPSAQHRLLLALQIAAECTSVVREPFLFLSGESAHGISADRGAGIPP